MRIETLSLQHFRNYDSETVNFGSGVNILTGRNGEGKTNMLEAIHILSMGRSFRTQNDAEAIKFGEQIYRVKGLFEKAGDELTVEVRMQGTSKSYFIDGIKMQKGAELLNHALTVIFSPDDLRIVKDGPEKRRRFMDHELFQLRPLYYIDVNKYKRIVRNRNLILKEPVLDERLLDVYDGYLAETGARIMAERAGFAARLAEISAGIQGSITAGDEGEGGSATDSTLANPMLTVADPIDDFPSMDSTSAIAVGAGMPPSVADPTSNLPAKDSADTSAMGATPAATATANNLPAPAVVISGVSSGAYPTGHRQAFPNPSPSTPPSFPAGLEISYEPSIDIAGSGTSAPELQEIIKEELTRRRAKDRDAGSTTAGPHKDDLKIVSGGIDLRKYGSQGQQRTAALALKLAEIDIIRAETGEMPILLLDDVLSELDESRQKRLLGSFEDCQIIITTADLSESLTAAFHDARRIFIEGGKVVGA